MAVAVAAQRSSSSNRQLSGSVQRIRPFHPYVFAKAKTNRGSIQSGKGEEEGGGGGDQTPNGNKKGDGKQIQKRKEGSRGDALQFWQVEAICRVSCYLLSSSLEDEDPSHSGGPPDRRGPLSLGPPSQSRQGGPTKPVRGHGRQDCMTIHNTR